MNADMQSSGRRDFLIQMAASVAAALPMASHALAQTPAPDPFRTLEDLVAANRTLASLGVFDAYGHVSMRSARDPKHYFMTRSLAAELVNEGDILEFDLDSNIV